MLTTIPIITANKQIPQQEIEHKANTNKVIQSLFHIGKNYTTQLLLKYFNFSHYIFLYEQHLVWNELFIYLTHCIVHMRKHY